MTEIWKAVPGFENSYEVSNLGRVRSLDREVHHTASYKASAYTQIRRGRFLRPGTMNRQGHVSVSLGRYNSHCVHAIVMSTFFVEPIQPDHEVRHLDGNGANNELPNLAYGNRSENNRDITRHNRRNLTVEQVHEARTRHAAGETTKSLAAHFSVCETNMSYILRGKYYAHV